MINIKITKRTTLGVRQAFIRKTILSHGSRFLYVLLMTYKGSDFSCFPSENSLAKVCGVNERTIRRWTEELKKNGFIETKRRGFNKSLSYRLDRYLKLNSQQPTTQNDLKTGVVVSTHLLKKGPDRTKETYAVGSWCPPTHIPIDTYIAKNKKKEKEISFKEKNGMEKLRAKIQSLKKQK